MAPISKAPKAPLTVQEYTILPLTLPSLPSFPRQTTHYLYLRHNDPKVPTPTTDRELFLVNVPIDATEQHLRALFKTALGGALIEKVDFEEARTGRKLTAQVAPKGKKRKRGGSVGAGVGVGVGPDGAEIRLEDAEPLPETWDRETRMSGSTAVVTVVDRASAEVVIKEAKRAAKEKRAVVWGQGVKEDAAQGLGSQRYLTHHTLRYSDAATLQASVDNFMAAFAVREAARAKALARQRQEPDEDGFITVVRGGRAGPARQEEAEEKAAQQKEKNKGMEDFYRFQIREKRKERAGELLRGFEEDKKRVMEMRKRRNKFRPN